MKHAAMKMVLVRVARIAAALFAGALVLVFLVLLALQIRPLRERLLREGLKRADSSLAGDLRVSGAGWPSFTRLDLRDILWTDGADTLVSARRFLVSVDLAPLLRKDVRVREIAVDLVLLDLPALQARFPAKGDTAHPAQSKPRAFPRNGSVPGIPSIAVDRIDLNATLLRLAPDQTLRDLRVLAGLDLRRSARPHARVDTLHLVQPEMGMRVDQVSLSWSLEGQGEIEAAGSGWLGPDFPFTLAAHTNQSGEYWLSLLREQGVQPPDGVGLLVNGRLLRDGRNLTGATADLLIRTPDSRDLAGLPVLRGTADSLPEMSGLIVSGSGSVQLVPKPEGSFRIQIEANGWVEGGRVEGAFGPERLRVQIPSLRFADLDLSGEFRKESGQQDGSVDAHVRGTEWARPFANPSSLPESLVCDLHASIHGKDSSGPEFAASLRGGLRKGTQRVRDIALEARGTVGDAPHADLGFTASAAGLIVSGAATVDKGETIEATLSPIRVLDTTFAGGARVRGKSGTGPPVPGADGPCHISFDPKTAAAEVRELQVTGSFGEIAVGGRFSKSEGGRFAFKASWPEAPEALLHRLPPESQKELALHWNEQGPYRVTGTAILLPQGGTFALDGSALFHLPGPRALSPLLPKGARVADLGPIQGEARVATSNTGGSSSVRFALDLGRTEWIDRFLVQGRRDQTSTLLDTLDVGMLGFEAVGGARMLGSRLEGGFRVALRDPRLLARFAPALGESVEAALEGDITIAGTTQEPAWNAHLNGHFRSRPADVPTFTLEAASVSSHSLRARFRTPQGIRVASMSFDSVRVRVDPLDPEDRSSGVGTGGGTASAGLAARISFDAKSKDLEIDQGLDLVQDAGWLLRTDSLYIRLDKQDLRASRSFTVQLRQAGGGIEIHDLDLAGSLGTVKAEGVYAPDATDLQLAVTLNPPKEPIWVPVPAGLWPSHVDLVARAQAGNTVHARMRVEGLQIGPRKDLALDALVNGLPDRVEGRVRLADSKGTIADAAGYLAGSLRLSPFAFVSRDGEFSAQAVFQEFPLPAQAGSPVEAAGYLDRGKQDRAPLLDLNATAQGRTSAPIIQVGGAVRFPDYDELKDYRVLVRAQILPDRMPAEGAGGSGNLSVRNVLEGMSLTQEDGFPDTLATLGIEGLPELPGPQPGLSVRILGMRKGQEVLTADAAVPLEFSLAPAGARLVTEKSMKFEARSPSLSLRDFTPLIPTMDRMTGHASFEFKAEGSAKNPELSGELEIPEAGFSLHDGTHATVRGSASFSGTMTAPVVRGRMTVDNGTIKIPETPKGLYPVEGPALLWDRRALASTSPESKEDMKTPEEKTLTNNETKEASPGIAQLDTTSSPATGSDTLYAANAEGQPGPLQNVDMSVHLDIPYGVWLTGRGLEVQLTGDIVMAQRGGKPVLVGTMRANQGKMEFNGRRLDIESGIVTFYGSETLNPSMDLVLVKKSDGIRAEVHITGTLEQPALALSSDPEMSQTDILSFIIFGKKKENLTEEQSKSLDQRAAATAEQFAASQFAARVSRELGLDVLSYEQSREDSLGRAVTVGKYISPNLLVKYEQTLENEKGFEISVQYWIGNGFKLETQGGRYEQSGFGLSWGQDF